MNHKFAVAVFIKCPLGVPLIRDPKKPKWCWKLPGGRSELGETPEKAAIREIMEETGLKIKEDNLRLVYKEHRENHFFIMFRTSLFSLEGLKSEGNEHEEVKIFSLEEIKTMPDFFMNHRKILEKFKII